MVEIATSLGRSGLQDWLIQRITAVILAAYIIFLVGYFFYYPEIHFEQWQILFKSIWMRYATFIALLSLVAHAWIGVWTIITDYIKPVFLRLITQVIIFLALFFYLVWGLEILWGLS
jgi:succinate dehydrogenase / fumarate reductase membrane anchor subunit